MRDCRSKASFKNVNIPINDYCFLIYCLLVNMSYYQIKNLLRVSSVTISRAKKALFKAFKSYSSKLSTIIGGIKAKVECDETVLSRR